MFAMTVFAMTVFVSNDPLLFFSFFFCESIGSDQLLAAEVATHSIFGYMIYVHRDTRNLGQPVKRRRERKGSQWLIFSFIQLFSVM